ncbi:sensor histidine kinase [Chengkuizengella sp. SCS-71B]|uniref:sensor histidine kinase n=1 Tax=Chengkuizengella sp. SCS-71B TaxID=3115290 RepID=UPI0032C21D54
MGTIQLNKKLLITILITIFIAIQCWFVFLTIKYPYTGIEVEKNDNNQWIISNVRIKNIESLNGIQIGDKVLQVNHEEASEHYSIQKWKIVRQFDHLLLSRNDRVFEVKASQISSYALNGLIPFMCGVFCYFQAILLMIRMPQLKSARFLSFLFFTSGLTFIAVNASTRADILAKIVVVSSTMTIPILFLQFLFVLIKEKTEVQQTPTKIFKYLYLVIILVFLFQLFDFFYTPYSYYFYIVTKNFAMIFFLLGLLINFIYLLTIYFKYRKEESYTSTLIKIIWFCLFITSAPFSLLSFLPDLLFGAHWVNPFYTVFFFFFFPTTFAYLILSKQILDIEVVIKRIIFTLVFSIIPSILIVIFISIIFDLKITIQNVVIAFICTLITLFLSLFSIKYILLKLENTIFPHKRGYQKSLDHILKKLTSITNFHDLKDQILTDIIDLFQVSGGVIVLKYKDKAETILVGKINVKEVEKLLDSTSLNEESPEYSIFQINLHQEYTSYLVLTKKKNNSKLGLEETQWMDLIISYMKVSLENIYFIRKYSFELQEKERFHISIDLHDSTLQDLLLLRRRISIYVEKSTSKEVNQELKNIVNYVDMINVGLRQNFFELNPYLIKETGLIKAVEQLVDQEKAMNNFIIKFTTKNADKIENSKMEVKQHVFRIIQELINNTKKHAEASVVNIDLRAIDHTQSLIYKDDGIGFDTNLIKSKPTELKGIGLEQIRYRVNDLNGDMKFITTRGNGVKLIINFPYN